ncbi:nucleoside hydrolase [Shimazuella kribbensis]|uniref:nucleoside hydrolase n=1 Tax=Shimazuella kribbensis TaxID=139808 RepID=UPI0004012EAB|nr:nucleoside hydrolase [Shimazuella kribbensis]
MQRVLLDVDTGIDDTLAISYAVRSTELDVIGITTCFGNVSVDQATDNTLHVLEQLEVDIPIAKGEGKPLFHPMHKSYSTHFHGENGLANQSVSRSDKHLPKHASQFIIEQVKKYPHEITIICVGSLTNLALTIMQEPEIISLVKNVVVMGGAVRVPGNNQMHAEANIYADPEAADIVFRSGIPITLVGLDVTMKTALSKKEIQKWKNHNTKVSNFLYEITDYYIDRYRNYYGDRDYCALHDPLAVAVAIDPSLVTIEPMVVSIDLEGLYSYGRTVADLRERCTDKPNVNVCVAVDSERFLAHFLQHIV